jgi:hypothetical protein
VHAGEAARQASNVVVSNVSLDIDHAAYRFSDVHMMNVTLMLTLATHRSMLTSCDLVSRTSSKTSTRGLPMSKTGARRMPQPSSTTSWRS